MLKLKERRTMSAPLPLPLHKRATEVRLQVGVTTPKFLELCVRHFCSLSGAERQQAAAAILPDMLGEEG